jgi:hypothetical protein
LSPKNSHFLSFFKNENYHISRQGRKSTLRLKGRRATRSLTPPRLRYLHSPSTPRGATAC